MSKDVERPTDLPRDLDGEKLAEAALAILC